SGGVKLTALVPGKPVTSGVILTEYANDRWFGDNQGDKITGKITNIDKGRSFDVVYRGSRVFTDKWVRRGPTFVKSGGETAMLQC
uniref:hypothetical protein n=1 Tax=Sphingomonas sp. TaxID=28214 RepID=UPI0025F22589